LDRSGHSGVIDASPPTIKNLAMKHETNFETAQKGRQPIGLFFGLLFSVASWWLIVSMIRHLA